MAHSHTQQTETFTPAEAHVSGGLPPLANAAADAYNPKDKSYASVFPSKASSGKSDHQVNSELANFSSPYAPNKVATPDHEAGIKDVHRSLNAVNEASSHLSDAFTSARNGDVNGALQALRSTSADMDKGGALLDRAQPNVGDLVKGDRDAQKSTGEAFYREGRADSHIQQAEEKLRRGDIKGALKEMGTTSKEMTEEQKALHHNLAQLNHDDQTYDHLKGFKDIRAAITGGDSVTSGLNDAIHATRLGDVNGAIQSLRQSAGDLNSAGARFDSGAGNVNDLIGTDKSARNHINNGFEAERDASFHLGKAERMLRDGDIDGALKAMNRGLSNVADEQANLRTGLKRLKNDYAPGYGDQQNAPETWYNLLSQKINPADRSDNGLSSGENPRSGQGNTAWDLYEASPRPMGPYAPGKR
ncbi:hypothetical protein BH10CYA1_BH10CYA1_00380 [soil metagenome]